MGTVIEQIQIRSFRGVNSELNLSFDPVLNIVYGPNGAGKSSIVQAVQWCLSGRVPYLSGGDFGEEDAIVNLFTPRKRASVSVVLKRNGEVIKITRTRPMRKTSMPGVQPLEIRVGERFLEGEPAEQYLSSFLDSELEEFAKNTVLHQQTIREALSRSPDERSRAIDRLLGTFEIREFIESLDPKRRISDTKKELEERIALIERDRIRFAVGLTEQLEKDETNLISRGYDKNHIRVDAATERCQHLLEEATDVAEALAAPKPKVSAPQHDANSLVRFISELEVSMTELDRFRVDALSVLQLRLVRLEGLRERHMQAIEALQSVSETPIESLQAQLAVLEKRRMEAGQHLTGQEQLCQGFAIHKASIERMEREIQGVEQAFSDLEGRHGPHEDWMDRADKFRQDNQEIGQRLSAISETQQLLTLATRYIEKAEPTSCPVCNQDMDPQEVLKGLRKATSMELLNEATSLRARRTSNQTLLEALETAVKEHSRLSAEMRRLTKSLDEAKKQLWALLGKPLEEDMNLDTVDSDLKKQLESLRQQANDLSNRTSETRAAIERPSQVRRSFETLQNSIMQELHLAEAKGLAEALDLEIEKTKQDRKPLDVRALLDQLGREATALKIVVEHLKRKVQLEELVKGLPQATKEIEALKGNKESLAMFEGSLQAIREAAMRYAKEAVERELGSLEQEMNEYYSLMEGHPYFSKLIVEITSETPLRYGVRAVNPEENVSSSIATRFSQAQMNLAALAIFLSNNRRLVSGLPLLVLDDPSQSMDEIHSKSLVHILSKLSEDRQIIVATHDERFKDLVIATVPSSKTIELTGWSQEGPQVLVA